MSKSLQTHKAFFPEHQSVWLPASTCNKRSGAQQSMAGVGPATWILQILEKWLPWQCTSVMCLVLFKTSCWADEANVYVKTQDAATPCIWSACLANADLPIDAATMSTWSGRSPKCSAAPLPVAPRLPNDRDSSTTSLYLYCSFSLQISRKGATSPRFWQMPSTTMKRRFRRNLQHIRHIAYRRHKHKHTSMS